MAKYDVILLDADMTLLDFARSEREALRRVLTKWGLPQEEQVLRTYSQINGALWDAFAREEIGQDFLVVERFRALLRIFPGACDPAAMNRDYELFLGEEAYLLEGAESFCRSLMDAGLTLALATNGLPTAQRGRYIRTGLNRLIPHLMISMELGAAKPQPEFFDRILEQLHVTDRSRTVMIGDGLETDILGANRAGLDSIWYNPDRKPRTGSACPTMTAYGYQEILEFLQIREGKR